MVCSAIILSAPIPPYIVGILLVPCVLPFIHKIIETNQINTSASTVNIVYLPEDEQKEIWNEGVNDK